MRGHGASVRLCGHDFFGEFHDGFQIGDGGVVQLAAALFPVAEGGEGEAVGGGLFSRMEITIWLLLHQFSQELQKLSRCQAGD